MTELNCSLRSLQIALEPDGDFKKPAPAQRAPAPAASYETKWPDSTRPGSRAAVLDERTSRHVFVCE
jgi:hypothetical protein